MQGLSDLTICEGDTAELEVKLSQENVKGTWLKNGQAIDTTGHVCLVTDKLTLKLVIEAADRDDSGIYSFTVSDQDISTSARLTVQSEHLTLLLTVFQFKCDSLIRKLKFILY